MDVRASSMESNQMSLAFEDRLFDKKEGRGGRIGCTLVTGFLGCGKTTLLQHILKNRGTLQIAVLVNEFGEIDVDSLLLDSSRINSSHGLSCLSLADGCACCATSGNLKEACRSAMSSKHNFDYVVIETSGLANPLAIATALEETGIRLDLVVTVVDVETLDTILDIPVARQQLAMADIVLINKCDLASLGAISDAEDRVEEATDGTKAVRCRFCSVPLDLVLNVALPDPPQTLATTTANSSVGFLSHEAATPIFSREVTRSNGRLTQGENNNHNGVHKSTQKREPKLTQFPSPVVQHEHDLRVASVSFSSDVPVSLVAFQDFVVSQLRSAKSLLRAKGVVFFEESRSTRHFFHFSGKKRSEAVYAGSWESQASTDIVFIGRDKRELELLKSVISEGTTVSRKHTETTRLESLQVATTSAEEFSRLVSSDTRFKVHNSRLEHIGDADYAGVHTTVVFGLVGSSLRGVHEGDLNASLMQAVNGRGIIFLSSASPLKAGGWLQLAFGGNITPEAAWCEIQSASTGVMAKAFRDVCPCRCDMVSEMHSHHAHREITQ